jgi:ubiquinone/menaquinone biosynthesis C-methylase UbiE
MAVSRETAIGINYILNNILPPIIRDSTFIMRPLFNLVFKDKASIFLNFRKNSYKMTEEEYVDAYRKTAVCNLLQDTDLNKGCIDQIQKDVVGKQVLEAGCGRGFLTKILAKKYKMVAVDIVQDESLRDITNVKFIQASVEKLPFNDHSIDTVICTHVLEHVRDIEQAVKELRRVAKKKLILVVPCERPYLFGFNLHLHFFPYEFMVYKVLGKNGKLHNQQCRTIQGDWYFTEDL